MVSFLLIFLICFFSFSHSLPTLYLFVAPPGFVIRLDFRNRFAIEPSAQCEFDYLEVTIKYENKINKKKNTQKTYRKMFLCTKIYIKFIYTCVWKCIKILLNSFIFFFLLPPRFSFLSFFLFLFLFVYVHELSWNCLLLFIIGFIDCHIFCCWFCVRCFFIFFFSLPSPIFPLVASFVYLLRFEMANTGFRTQMGNLDATADEISPTKFTRATASCGYAFIPTITSNMKDLKASLNSWNVPRKQVWL